MNCLFEDWPLPPRGSPTPTADCAWANEAQKGLIGGNTEAQNERTPSGVRARGP